MKKKEQKNKISSVVIAVLFPYFGLPYIVIRKPFGTLMMIILTIWDTVITVMSVFLGIGFVVMESNWSVLFLIIASILASSFYNSFKVEKEKAQAKRKTIHFIEEMQKNNDRIVRETFDLINNSKNIETVLSRIEFGIDKGFITDSIDDLQIGAIERCYNLTIEKSTEKNKQRNVDKYIKVVNEHRESFSPTVLASLDKLVQQPIIISVETKIEHNLPFDDEYLNTVLDDGKTIREHMQEGFDEAMKKSNMMDEQEDIKLNDMESEFVDAFISALNPYGLDTAIRYNRMSSGVLNFTYKDMQIGRIKLRGKKMNIQVLYDDSKGWDVKYFDVTTLDDATSHIDEWMNYLQFLIKNETI